jgi:mannose-6-phosphate isomerase-like protein (cupin superfamily)
MTPPFTHKNVLDVTDSAPALGVPDRQETRFASDDFDAEQTGFTHHLFKPGQRQAFGHRHERAEDVFFVVAGSGRMKLDDMVIELKPRDVVRVAPTVVQAFEAGPEGLEVLAFGARHENDGELVHDWWKGD